MSLLLKPSTKTSFFLHKTAWKKGCYIWPSTVLPHFFERENVGFGPLRAAAITEFEDETYEWKSKPALCWPHIIRNAVQTNRDKLKAAAFQVQGQEDLKLLYPCWSGCEIAYFSYFS